MIRLMRKSINEMFEAQRKEESSFSGEALVTFYEAKMA